MTSQIYQHIPKHQQHFCGQAPLSVLRDSAGFGEDDDQDANGAGAEDDGVDDLEQLLDEWEEDENDDGDENPGPDDEAGVAVPSQHDQPGDFFDMGEIGASQPPNENENQVVPAEDDGHDAESEHGKTNDDDSAERPVARPLASIINKQLDFSEIVSDDDDVVMVDDGLTSTSLASSSAGPTPCERAAQIRKLLVHLQDKLGTLEKQSLCEFN